ncbi:hypothetical protein MKX08_005342 [Trichoderma sp. CBMAI-0020]|nr:hypothetical protein MKX08_005342 [Trichoderma sp. CBMAI-0020]WOD45747.1 hypothetical protein [Trichoderma atroviride]
MEPELRRGIGIPLPSSSSRDARKRTTPSLSNYTSVFVVAPDSEQTLCEIPTSLVMDPFRQKRLHHKSKRGCLQCRKRRVKCDEKLPTCSACIRRQESCSFKPVTRRREIENSGNVVDEVPRSLSQRYRLPLDEVDEAVNLLQMKLFHHFQRDTIPTLLFPSQAWENALQLSFSFPSLMHAMLCESARHLSYLFPDEQKYATAATTHLTKTLSLYCNDLSSNFTPSNVDAIMSTTTLLAMDMWSNTEFAVLEPNGTMSYDPLKDHLFQHSVGILHVFLSCVPISLHKQSSLLPYIRYSSRTVLVNAAKLSKCSFENFRRFFAYDRPISPSLLSVPLPFVRNSDLTPESLLAVEVPKLAEIGPSTSKEAGYSLQGYYGIVDRLCLILSFLPEAQDGECEALSPELTRNLSRYLIIFPILCDQQFVSMVRHGDLHAMVLLYHFYRAVRILVPSTEHWWAKKRASLAETAMKQWILRECTGNGTAAEQS